MNVKVITDIQAFLNLKEAWESLTKKTKETTYFNTFNYNRIWWEIYKKEQDKKLFIIVIFENKQIVGIAPLIIQEIRNSFKKYRLLRFMGISHYNNFIFIASQNNENKIIRCIFKTIFSHSDLWDQLNLAYISSNFSLASYLFRNVQLNPFFKIQTGLPYIKLSGNSSFESFINTRDLPSDFNRYIRKLKREYAYQIEELECSKPETIETLLSFDKQNPNEYSPLKNSNKIELFKKTCEANDYKIFKLANLGGEPVSFAVFYKFNRKLHFWYTGYNATYKNTRPGHVLMYEILKRLFEKKEMDEIDFGSGNFAWKFEWTRLLNHSYTLDLWSEKLKPDILKNDITCDHKITHENNQTDFPLVSVIIRTKDRPALLREAIVSVNMQSYPNIEIILVNDGGKDVAYVISDFHQKPCQIKYIYLEKNIGRSGAAKAGLENISGDYFMFLDDDDLWDMDHVSSLVDAIRFHPQYRVAYSGVRLEGNKPAFNKPYNSYLLKAENYIPINAVIFHRQLLDAGCCFDENLKESDEIWDFLLQAACFTDFYHLNHISATYRDKGNSMIGPYRADSEIIQSVRLKIFDKWGKKWSPQDLNDTFLYFLTQSRELSKIQYEKQTLESWLKALEIEIRAVFNSLSWRVGRFFVKVALKFMLKKSTPTAQDHIQKILTEIST
ncbi:Glycosyl transferase, family 2 domain protein [Candidatus Magnetomorum sp. HK-1]|nr:Glycosyl transferase, family 2 domain protein [Candidatus Magnetomorum sp. HK-1]